MYFLLSPVFAALTVLLSFAFATSKTSTHTPAHILTHNSTHNATNATQHLNYLPYIERPLMQEDCEIGLHFNPNPNSYNVSIILWNYNGTKIGSLKTWSGQQVLIPTSLDPTKKLKLELNNVPFKSDYEKIEFYDSGKIDGVFEGLVVVWNVQRPVRGEEDSFLV